MGTKGLRFLRSNVVAVLALFVALGGTGYAASGGFTAAGGIKACAASNGVLKLQTGNKCKKGQKALTWNRQGVPGPKGPPGAVGAPGDMGAANPNATAINGQSISPLFATVAPDAPPVQIYSRQGLTLLFSCPNGGVPRLAANGPAGAAAVLIWQGNSNVTEKTFHGRQDHLGPGAEEVIGEGQFASGTAEYATASGHVVTVTYAVDNGETGISETDCSVWGHAVSG